MGRKVSVLIDEDSFDDEHIPSAEDVVRTVIDSYADVEQIHLLYTSTEMVDEEEDA